MVHLCLGTLNIGLVNVWHLRESLVRLLLVIEGLPVITELVVSMRDGLVAGDDLQVALPEDLQVPIERLEEAVDGRLEMLEILVHQAQVQVEGRDVRVVLSRGHLQNRERSVHVLEGSREVPTGVMVEGEVGVAIGCLGVVPAQHALLNDNALSLKVDGLEEVAEFELDGRQLGDGRGHLLIHGSCYLEQSVYALAI